MIDPFTTNEAKLRRAAEQRAAAFREALAQAPTEQEQPAQEQEPAGYFRLREYGEALIHDQVSDAAKHNDGVYPLYTSPQPAQPSKPWVGLTKEDRYKAIRPLYCDDATAALAACHSNDEYEAIEAKLREKNAQPAAPDWNNVGRLIEAAHRANAAGHLTGTSNWAAAVCKYMLAAAPEQKVNQS